jgi:hypothetical protein
MSITACPAVRCLGQPALNPPWYRGGMLVRLVSLGVQRLIGHLSQEGR